MDSDGRLPELIRAAKAGDRMAFSNLIERDGSLAYRAALAVLGSAEDARDVVQNASLRAWQRLPDLREPSAWPSWYRRIVVRTAVDYARQRHRSREMSLRIDIDTGQGPDPALSSDERLTILAAVNRLSPDDRAVLGLRFGADLDVPDIAATLGIRLGTAKARLHRALRRLRKAMGEDDDY
jgi:RNA polymerase sigma-70 factor (ECF subfamily)